MKSKCKKMLGFLLDWKENREMLRWLFRIGKNYKRYIFAFLLINLLTMVISLGSSIAGRYVVDAATGYRSELFVRYIVIMLTTTVVSIIISTASGMLSTYVNEKFAFGIRADMYDRVQRSAWHRLSAYHSGDMLSRLTGDIDSIATTLISLVPNLIVTACQLVLVLIILLKYDPTLALIGLIVGPLGMIAAIVTRRKYIEYQQKLRENHSDYYAFLQESLSSIGVVKTFQLESRNNARFEEIRAKRMNLVLRSAVLNYVMGAVMRLVYSIGYVVTFSWCAYRLTTATTIIDPSGVEVASYTYGTMTLFLSLVSQVQGAIRSLGGTIPRFYSLVVCAKRVREITNLEAEDYTPIDTMPKQVSLRAENVSFTYENEMEPVLREISITIPARSRVGIVGTSGAGKTTFIRLLMSLLHPDSGSLIYIDENGGEETVCPASRRFISYVPQGNTLMSGSIRSNLAAGNPDAADEQMWQALEMADAADFLRRMPKGLDTVLSESAGGISEGQAQRIAIARALLRDRPVLILDEATSALDEGTETRIFARIAEKCDKTCFIITHRRSMLAYCDHILEIDANGHAVLTENRGRTE